MTVALHSIIRKGREHDYDVEHRVVWPELAELLHTCGIKEWRIWRSGRNLFHLVECDDFDASLALLDASPLNQRWQDHINTIVDHFEHGPDGMAIRHVWSLSEQRSLSELPSPTELPSTTELWSPTELRSLSQQRNNDAADSRA